MSRLASPIRLCEERIARIHTSINHVNQTPDTIATFEYEQSRGDDRSHSIERYEVRQALHKKRSVLISNISRSERRRVFSERRTLASPSRVVSKTARLSFTSPSRRKTSKSSNSFSPTALEMFRVAMTTTNRRLCTSPPLGERRRSSICSLTTEPIPRRWTATK